MLKRFWRVIFAPALLLFGTACLKILRPLLRLRVGWLHYGRLGHLGENTELFLRRQTINSSRERCIFISGKPANFQLLTMVKRRLPVLEIRHPIPARLENIVIECLKRADMYIDLLSLDLYAYDAFNNIAPQLSFNEEEERKGNRLLKRMDIEPGTPFVCFHARDKAYLDAISLYNLSYHDFRDCDIQNYMPAAKYLASCGMFALRMGQIVESALAETHPRIIDYVTHHRTDFGDIYLAAKCKFFLGNTAGICCFRWIFHKPSAFANFPHSGIPPFFKKDLFIVKKPWHVARKRFLTFREVFEYGIDGWWRSDQFAQAGIELIENTADEICALAKEMNARIDCTWVNTEEDEELQARYRALFPSGHPASGFRCRMGAEFLRQNQELLD